MSDEAPLIEDARAVLPLPDGRFEVICKDGTHQVVTADDFRNDRPGNPRICAGTETGAAKSVLLYARTDCTDAITRIRPTTDCNTVALTEAKSVKVDGVCTELWFTPARTACTTFKPQVGPKIMLHASLNCTDALALVGANTDCNAVPLKDAQSISVDGVCTELWFTPARTACTTFKPQDGPKVMLHAKVGCTDALATIGPNTDCNIVPLKDAQSISVDGVCTELWFTPARTACTTFKPQVGPKVMLHAKVGCTDALATLGPNTDCNTVPLKDAQSVSIDGVCTELSFTPARNACAAFKPQEGAKVMLYRTLGCTNALALVGAATDCNTLPDTETQAVTIDGACTEIRFQGARSACAAFKPD